jgi:phosphatidylinositol glycan class K
MRVFVGAFLALLAAVAASAAPSSGHTNNWAVIVSTSRFWFNYRHSSNALSVYRTVKRLGIPDSQIVLMLADDMVCDARNVFPGRLFGSGRTNLYSGDDRAAEVDYRGYEVTTENFLRVLAGRHGEETPRAKRLQTDAGSNVLVYMTGHGAEDVMKFQDSEELSGQDIADCLAQMHTQQRFHRLLFVADTCHAASLQRHFYTPGVLAIASADVEEDSLSMPPDGEIGVTMVDKFTHYTFEFFEGINKVTAARRTLRDLVKSYSRDLIQSSVIVRTDLFPEKLEDVPLIDFFGHTPQSVSITTEGGYPM